MHADLPAAACRDYLLSARGFNNGRHQRDVHEAYLAVYAIYRRRVVMNLQGPLRTNKSYPPAVAYCKHIPRRLRVWLT